MTEKWRAQELKLRVDGFGFRDESRFSGWSDLFVSSSSARARVEGLWVRNEG